MNKVKDKLVHISQSSSSLSSSSLVSGLTEEDKTLKNAPSKTRTTRKRGRPDDEPPVYSETTASSVSSVGTIGSSSSFSTSSSTSSVHEAFRTIVSHIMYVSGERSTASLTFLILDEVIKDTIVYLKFILRTMRAIQGTDNIRVGDFAKLMPETLRAYFRWKTLKELAQPDEGEDDSSVPPTSDNAAFVSSSTFHNPSRNRYDNSGTTANESDSGLKLALNLQHQSESIRNSSANTTGGNKELSTNESNISDDTLANIDVNDEILENFQTQPPASSTLSPLAASVQLQPLVVPNEEQSSIIYSSNYNSSTHTDSSPFVTIPMEDAEELKQLQELQDAADEELRSGISLPKIVNDDSSSSSSKNVSTECENVSGTPVIPPSSSATMTSSVSNPSRKTKSKKQESSSSVATMDKEELSNTIKNSLTMKLFYARLNYFNLRSLTMTTKQYTNFVKSREYGFTGTARGNSSSNTSTLQIFASLFPLPTPSRTTLEILAYLGYDRISHIVETTANIYMEEHRSTDLSSSSLSSSNTLTDIQEFLTTYPFPLPNKDENSITFSFEMYQKALTLLPKLPLELVPLLSQLQGNVNKHIEKDHLKQARESEYLAIVKDKEQMESIKAKWADGIHDRQGDQSFLTTMLNIQNRTTNTNSNNHTIGPSPLSQPSATGMINLHSSSPLSINRAKHISTESSSSIPPSSSTSSGIGIRSLPGSTTTAVSSSSIIPGTKSNLPGGRLKSIIHRT